MNSNGIFTETLNLGHGWGFPTLISKLLYGEIITPDRIPWYEMMTHPSLKSMLVFKYPQVEETPPPLQEANNQNHRGFWWSSVRRCSILSQWWSYQIVFELSEANYRHSWLTVWTNPGGGMYPISLVARLVRTADNSNDIATRDWRHAKSWPAKEETQLKAR